MSYHMERNRADSTEVTYDLQILTACSVMCHGAVNPSPLASQLIVVLLHSALELEQWQHSSKLPQMHVKYLRSLTVISDTTLAHFSLVLLLTCLVRYLRPC
jgi:hypothetical protein